MVLNNIQAPIHIQRPPDAAAPRPSRERPRALLFAAILLAFSPGPEVLARLSGAPLKTAGPAGFERIQEATHAAQEPEKRPEPSPADQKKAEKLIREQYREQYAGKSPADVKSLAARLLQDARKTQDDDATMFVLLREARELALQVGNTGIALQAIEAMDRNFRTNTGPLRLAVLTGLAKSAARPEDCVPLAREGMKQKEWFARNDDYPNAEKALGVAESAARRTRDPALMAQVQSEIQEVQATRREHERVKSSIKALGENPDDPSANLSVGRFFCLVKGDWPRGLPHLSKGSDPVLKEAAGKDLAEAADAESQMAVGDAWWSLSEKQKGSTKSRIQERALHWYRLAWKGLADAAREHARSRFRTALSRSGGPPSRKPAEAPDRWEPGIAKDRILVDDAFAHGGRYSVKLPAVQGRGGSFTQKVILAPGRKYVFTAWVLTDRTDHPAPFIVTIWHGAGSIFEGPAIPLDQPWWTQVEATYECPANTESLQIAIRSKDNQSGNVWVDDLSLKGVDDDIELLENGSFEK